MSEDNPLNKTATILAKRSQEVIDRRSEQIEESGLKVSSIEMPDSFEAPQQLELFVLETLDFSLKDEIEGMTLPIFAISQKAQKDTYYDWVRHDGKVRMRIEANKGRPTQHDKDLLIFVVSALMAEYNASGVVPDVLEMQTRHYLLGTERKDGGTQYSQFEQTLDRIENLKVTTIEDLPDGTSDIARKFMFFGESEVKVRTETGKVLAVKIPISSWLKDQITSKNVLTMTKDYFRLTGSLERRMYEICRKHCGKQGMWRVSLKVLHNLTGSGATLKRFKQSLLAIIESDVIPEYRLSLDGTGIKDLMINIKSKNAEQLAKRILKGK